MMRTLLISIFLLCVIQAKGQGLQEIKRLFEQKKLDDAKKIALGIKEGTADYAEARFWLGRIMFEKQDLPASSEYFEEAIEANGKVANYHYWLGAAYGVEAQRSNIVKQGWMASKIKDAFERCVALDPKHQDALDGLMQFYLQAPSFMGGDPAKAMEMANLIKEISPLAGHKAIASVYINQKKIPEAEAELKKAIAIAPTDFSAHYMLGNFYFQDKQYDKAFGQYESFLVQTPNHMPAKYQVGKVAAFSGQNLEKGEVYLTQYLQYQPTQQDPSHSGANLRLGMIYEKKGDKSLAKKHYELALKLDPTLQEAKDGLKRVS